MKRLPILVVASAAGCANNFRTCSQDSECQSDGVCSTATAAALDAPPHPLRCHRAGWFVSNVVDSKRHNTAAPGRSMWLDVRNIGNPGRRHRGPSMTKTAVPRTSDSTFRANRAASFTPSRAHSSCAGRPGGRTRIAKE